MEKFAYVNTMFNKRLFYYLLLNVVVSAITILLVLSLWEYAHSSSEMLPPQPISALPTALASSLPTALPTALVSSPPTALPTALASSPPTALQTDPEHPREQTAPVQTGSPAAAPPQGTDVPLPAPDDSQIKIVTIIGVGDLATERVQIQSVSPDAISLENWRLETSAGEVYTFPKITLFEYGAVDIYTRAGVNSVVALYWGRSAPVFQRGDRATIYDSAGNIQAVYNIP